MAEGGGYFGHEDPELDKLLDHDDNDDNDEEQEVNITREFQPGRASTPYHGGEEIQMQTMQHEKSGLPDTSYEETPLLPDYVSDIEERLRNLRRNSNTSLLDIRDVPTDITSNILSPQDQEKEIQNVKDFIKKKYQKVDFGKLGPIRFSSKKPMEIVVAGPKGGETKIVLDDGSGLRSDFLNKTFVKKALGPKTETLISQEKEKIQNERKRLRDAEKQLKERQKIEFEKEKAAQEAQDLRIRIERTNAKMDQLGSNVENESELRRLKQLKKNLKKNAKTEVAALEKQAKQKEKDQTRVDQLRVNISEKNTEISTMQERLNETKTFDELREQEDELKRQNEQDKKIIEDENASPSEKQAAEDRVAERTEELGRLQTQIAERERALPLRHRQSVGKRPK
ncbi:hypothetical protein ACROYT_G041047 [Oculina patagonica]